MVISLPKIFLKGITTKGITTKANIKGNTDKVSDFKTYTLQGSAFLSGAYFTGKRILNPGDFSTNPIANIILKIIQQSYKNDYFYRTTWKIKSQILAEKIAKQFDIEKQPLSDSIYYILRANKNRQGNEKLAIEIYKKIKPTPF